MSEARVGLRLAEGRSRREWLQEDTRGIAEENARIRRHLDAVRAAEASAATAARGTRDRFEDALENLGTTLAIARHPLASELTDNRHLFERAVEAELHDWDTYVERVQRRAVAKGGSAGEPSQLAIDELTSRHREAARLVDEMRSAPNEVWREPERAGRSGTQ